MSDDRLDPGRPPAEVGPTDHRLTSGIEADVGAESESPGGAVSDEGGTPRASETSERAVPTPKWASSIRNVLAGAIFVLVGIYLAMGQPDPHDGLAQIVVFVGLLVGLYGFITWPPSGNVS